MRQRLHTAVTRYLRDDCRALDACARDAADCADAQSCSVTRPSVDRLLGRVRRHVRLSRHVLPRAVSRRLHADHQRMARLADGVERAMDAGDLPRIGEAARKLALFTRAHEQRERPLLGG